MGFVFICVWCSWFVHTHICALSAAQENLEDKRGTTSVIKNLPAATAEHLEWDIFNYWNVCLTKRSKRSWSTLLFKSNSDFHPHPCNILGDDNWNSFCSYLMAVLVVLFSFICYLHSVVCLLHRVIFLSCFSPCLAFLTNWLFFHIFHVYFRVHLLFVLFLCASDNYILCLDF